MKDLMRDEGVRQEAYRDSVGLWTIGCGHLLGDGAHPRMTVITDDEVEALLQWDVNEAVRRASSYVLNWTSLDVVRQDALINMAFNLGNRLGAFSKFLKAVNDRNWPLAGVEMLNSRWAKQVGQRAIRLQHMIETGERQHG